MSLFDVLSDDRKPVFELSKTNIPKSYYTLNDNQKIVFEQMASGQDVFVTGVAGTGKSYLMNVYNEWAKANGKNVCVVAFTGIAAYLVKGVTVHSQFGFGRGVLSPKFNYSNYFNNLSDRRREVLATIDVIEIEEISMLRFDYFRRIMKILDAEEERRYDAAFNKYTTSEKGTVPFPSRKDFRIQRILCGDFGQLSPILNSKKAYNRNMSEREIFQEYYGDVSTEGWAFLDEENWKRFKPALLTKVMRQQDERFVSALNQIRMGNLEGLRYINEHRARRPKSDDTVIICGMNAVVDRVNSTALSLLSGPVFSYKLKYEVNPIFAKEDVQLDKSMVPVDELLEIKIGAKVMVTVNDSSVMSVSEKELGKYKFRYNCDIADVSTEYVQDDPRFRNGSFGEVVDVSIDYYTGELKAVIVYLINEGIKVMIIPYTWKIEEYQAVPAYINYNDKYYSMSLVSDIKKEYNFNHMEALEHLEITGLYEKHMNEEKLNKKVLIRVTVGTITGIPLRLRYAMTVHKSQGNTFDSIALNVDFWAYGQLYTALSRVTSLDGLYFRNDIRASNMLTSNLVKNFYENLKI